ncbi:MAG: hypothetical protein L3K17_10515, partial [Thermoplasmata archaeon]|nr:hypothetical protein [Thermoplasmata archaeon]
RNDDALAFTYSTDSGVSFHNVTTIQNAGHGNIAVPSLAAYGKTVYIAYMNISNTTAGATLGGSTSTPVSVELVWSNNSGKFWRGPITLRGFNASESYNAMDPQVVVAPNGTVLVAYSTNRHCIAYCATTSQVYGDDIELAASGNNGTTWSTYLVAKDFGTGEYLGTQPAGLYYYPTISGSGSSTGPWIFEQGPMISLAVSPTGGHIYVAWAGGVNQSAPPYCCDTYQEYSITQLFVGVSSNGGASWANTTLGPEVQQGADLYEGGVSLPGLGVSPTGTVYLTFQYLNGSSGVNCLNQGVFGANYQMTQFVATSANGLSWNSPVTTAWNLQGNGGWWTMGWWSSVAFNVSTGAPLIGYTLPIAQSVIGSFTSFPGVVQLASGWVGTTTSLTLTETNLTAGTPWSAWVDGNVFSSSSSSMTVTNVPSGPDVWVSTANPIPVSAGYGAAYLPTMQFLTPIRLVGPTTFFFNYSLFYDLNISTNPAMTGYTGFGISAGLFSINNYFTLGQFAGGCPFPWFVPAGLHVDMVSGGARDYYNLPVGASYWNGTGTGSFTGPGVAGAWAMGGPVNETIWYTAYSTYNVSVGALGIPGGALVHFKWDGTAHTFTAPNQARVAGVPTGLHAVTNVSANSSVVGWEYFGTPVGGNPVSIPDTPVVNLSFSFVNIARPVGTVSFHANGLTAGTTWHFEFNGTDYASSTPWINVTGRPGTYPVAAFPVVAANGSAAYAPTGVPSNLSVTTSSTYQVQYTSAFQVVVVAGAGGHVSPSGTSYWVAPGTAMSFTATPVAGSTFGEWTGKGAGSFSGTNPVANFTVEGPIVETASFYAPTANRFSLSFSETGLPSGTWWSVFLDGAGHSTNTPSLNVTGLYSCPTSGSLGSYTVVVPYSYSNTSQGVRYVPGSYRSPLCGGSPPVTIAFSTQYYLTLESTAG